MTLRKFYILFFLLLGACIVTKQNKTFIGGWTDKDYDFFESIEHNSKGNYLSNIVHLKWAGTRWGLDYENEMFQWLRKPENINKFFNTIYLIGLEEFIGVKEYNEKLFEDDYWNYDWESKSLNDICKTLIDCYSDTTGIENYYKEFWERRKIEHNEKVVFETLCKIDNYYNDKLIENYVASENYDTTLLNLLTFNVQLNKSDSLESKKIITQYFDYLKANDLNHSAYNLIFEVREYESISLNRDSLLLTLQPDTLSEETYWKTRNNAKWIVTYRDNGP